MIHRGNLEISFFTRKGYITAPALQKQMGQNSSFNPLSTQNSFKIKQKPTLSIQRKIICKTEYLEPKTTKISMNEEKTGNPNHAISAETVIHQIIANHAKRKTLLANHAARRGTSPKCAILGKCRQP